MEVLEKPQGLALLDVEPKPDALALMVSQALATYDPLVAEIDELRDAVQNTVFDLTKTKERKEAIRIRAAINAIPGKLDGAYKAWNQPRLKAAESMRDKAAELKALVPGIVEPLDKQIKLDDERREQDRIAEIARVDGIRTKLSGITALPIKLAAASADQLAQTIAYLRSQEVKAETFAEFLAEATQAVADVLAALEVLRVAAVKREEDAAELVRLREQQALRDKEEADRREKERLENEARLEQQRQDEEAARQRKILADAEEQARVDAHNQAIADSARALAAQRDAFANELAIAKFAEGMRSKLTDAAMNQTSAFVNQCMQEVAAADFRALFEADTKGILGDVKEEVLSKLSTLLETVTTREVREADAAAQAAAAIETAKAPAPQQAAALSADQQLYRDSGGALGTADAPQAAASVDVNDALLELNTQAQADANDVALEALLPDDAIVRPDDKTILHMVATTFGVSEAIALDWFSSMDLSALENHVEYGNV
jgi:hypothetical protein